MAADFSIGSYYRGESVIHRLDPRVKLNLLLLIMVILFIPDDFIGLGIITLFMLVIWLLAKIPFAVAGRAIWPLALFAMFPVLVNFFFISDGQELFHWGIILITDRGIYLGLFMGLRLFLMFASGVLLTLTTTTFALAFAVGQMLAPFERLGLPAYEISLMMHIALRFIPDIGKSFNHIRKAQQARGAVFDRGGPLRRVKALVPCLVPLFAECFRNAEYLGLAMESRCYHGGSDRSHYRQYRVGTRDLLALGIFALLIAGLVMQRLFG